MARIIYNQTNFTGGELSPRIMGRTDFDKYFNGCSKLENFIPLIQGGITRRPGFHTVMGTKDDGEACLVPFVFSKGQAYVLEFGSGYIRFYSDHGQIIYDIPESTIPATYTADLCVGGTPICGTGTAALAFNNSAAAPGWVAASGGADWIGYDFGAGNAKAICKYTLQARPDAPAQSAKDVALQGSDTGAWAGEETVLDTQTGLTWASGTEVETFTLENAVAFRYYRIHITACTGAWNVGSGEVELMEIDTPEEIIPAQTDVAYEIASPYTDIDEIRELHILQSNDVLMLFHQNHAPRKLSRLDHTDWTLEYLTMTPPPTRPARHYLDATLTPNGVGPGLITVNASASIFLADDVGQLIHINGGVGTIYQVVSGTQITMDAGDLLENTDACAPGDWYMEYAGISTYTPNATFTFTRGSILRYTPAPATFRATDLGKLLHIGDVGMARITLVSGPSDVQAQIEVPFSQELNKVLDLEILEDEWSTGDYPRTGCLYQNRLITGGTLNNPLRVDGSITADWFAFGPGALDDSALQFTLGAHQQDGIAWMSAGKFLLIGTPTAEWSMGGGGDPLTPSNVNAQAQTFYGGAPIQPIPAGPAVLFVHSSLRRIYEAAYNFETDATIAADLTEVAEHIFRVGIAGWCYSQYPHSIVWIYLTDGTLVGMTYNRPQKVIACHKHPIDGTVESVCSIHNDGVDELWAVMNRTIDGAPKRTIEYLRFEDVLDLEDAFFVDGGLTYTGAPATEFSGLSHLEGKTVSVLADGVPLASQLVDGEEVDFTIIDGALSPPLATAASPVHIGLPYTSEAVTMPIEPGVGQRVNVVQGRRYQILRALLRLYQTAYVEMTTASYESEMVPLSRNYDPAAPALFSGDRPVAIRSSMDTAVQAKLKTAQPLPCEITNILFTINLVD